MEIKIKATAIDLTDAIRQYVDERMESIAKLVDEYDAAAMVEVACETDFVAKTPEFETLCKEVAMQVVSMNPENVEELLKQEYIRDASVTIEQLVKTLISKTGENIRVVRFARFKLGEE